MAAASGAVAPKSDETPTLVEAVVARGRTVITGGAVKTADGVFLGIQNQTFGPGQVVSLPQEEVDQLRAEGTLLAEGEIYIPAGVPGPNGIIQQS